MFEHDSSRPASALGESFQPSGQPIGNRSISVVDVRNEFVHKNIFTHRIELRSVVVADFSPIDKNINHVGDVAISHGLVDVRSQFDRLGLAARSTAMQVVNGGKSFLRMFLFVILRRQVNAVSDVNVHRWAFECAMLHTVREAALRKRIHPAKRLGSFLCRFLFILRPLSKSGRRRDKNGECQTKRANHDAGLVGVSREEFGIVFQAGIITGLFRADA